MTPLDALVALVESWDAYATGDDDATTARLYRAIDAAREVIEQQEVKS